MILGTSRAVRVCTYPEPVDLRKGYDGLYGLVKQGLKRDPLSGDLFLFCNRRRERVTLCTLLQANGSLSVLESRYCCGVFGRRALTSCTPSRTLLAVSVSIGISQGAPATA